MNIISFHSFVDVLDAALRCEISDAESIILEEQPSRAQWTRDAFRAGVERLDLAVRAWVGLEGHVAREFHEPLTRERAERLGSEFAALLSGLRDDAEPEIACAEHSSPEWNELLQHLEATATKFMANDRYLIEKDVNERSMTHRFATYLQERLPDFHVDCEYNRDGGLPKTLLVRPPVTVQDDDTEGTTKYPDIIVHRRGTRCNLLIIEAKKSAANMTEDRDKIVAFMTNGRYGYQFGVQLHFKRRPPGIDIIRVRTEK